MTPPQPKTVLCCIGTRPEAIKMAPVVRALLAAPWARCRVLAAAQHRELLDQMLAFFDITADLDLNVMKPGQELPLLTARLITRLDETLRTEQPDFVLAQGDTTTVLCVALACFYRDIPFGHVEAGLRTGNLRAPFPEEANRALSDRLATLHFAPTARARENLLREGIRPESLLVTGNTVIDALYATRNRNIPIGIELDPAKRLILVTAHRRESFGPALDRICRAVAALADNRHDVELLWPVHPNPSVAAVVHRHLDGKPNVTLCEPLDYGRFVAAMQRAWLLLTDSGGLQEEGPALGKPVLVLRETSERPEAVEAGVAELVGTDPERILTATRRLLDDPEAYAAMTKGTSPFGDGRAADRIVAAVAAHLGTERPSPPKTIGFRPPRAPE